MLLESSELESCLDRLLDRVCSITGCDAAMLALLDPDASDHGRAYLAAGGTHAPVTRISLDALMLSQLCQERSGLTVMRLASLGATACSCRCRKAAASSSGSWAGAVAGNVLGGRLAVG